MDLVDTNIVPVLTSFFQKSVKIEMGDKMTKEGVFLLFKQNGSFVQITLSHPKRGTDLIEIPYPMRILKDSEKIVFDYNVKHVAKTAECAELAAKILASAPSRNKFYNTSITFTIV